MSQAVDRLLHEKRVFFPPEKISSHAHIKNLDAYYKMYRESVENSEKFWLKAANQFAWFKKPTKARRFDWSLPNVKHTWFEDGELNLTVNCLDRHLDKEKIAILWEGDEEGKQQTLTYRELHREVCRFANVLKSLGVVKGDRVCLYLPMIPELAIAMLACARIGAIHSVVFGGFSAESLAHRINDSSCSLLITASVSSRGGKPIHFKRIADEALAHTPSIEKVLLIQTSDAPCEVHKGRDLWYHEASAGVSFDCPPEVLNAEDPLFILYTSGSTAKPKGMVHTQAGYLIHAALSHKYVFDIHEKDIYWCTADIGWVTGHSYIVYGPLANGSTVVMFEGTPTYPDPGRFWRIVDKYKVSVFYTAPTAIRALIAHGDEFVEKHSLKSLRVLGTVGEPINPESWIWYYEKVGHGNCPIVDTWWQTETGGIMIAPLPGSHPLKPGSATKPFFGVEPVILNEDGSECPIESGGSLCIKNPWPGLARTMWGSHDLFMETYFTHFPNHYFTGDSAVQDRDGDFWLLGRIDDVVNVSGHRIGVAEVESALVSYHAVSEAAVVPCPHPIKGQGLYAFVILRHQIPPSDKLIEELKLHVRKEIGPIAVPETIHFTPALPKTRSGKIMRRILRCIVNKQLDRLGDISTLADPDIVPEIIRGMK